MPIDTRSLLASLSFVLASGGCANPPGDDAGNDEPNADADSDGDAGDDGAASATMATVRGTVRDASGEALAGVVVEYDGGATQTSQTGGFSIEFDPSTSAVVVFRKDGFVRGLERVDISSATPTTIEVTMIPMAPGVDFDSSLGGHVDGVRGATMDAPADAFMTRDGADVTGMVEVHLTPLNPSVPAELLAYPGDGMARDASGELITLETFGVLDVTVMQGDEELDIRNGMGVDVTVPLPDPLPAEPPETIALWGFDDDAGVWVEEGIATLDLDAGVYRGTITHLSPWNCDQPMSATCIRGRAIEEDGDAVAGAYVMANGIDYAGNSSAVADDRGDFCVPVRKDSQVEVVVFHPGGGKVSRPVQSGSADTSIPPVCTDPDCLDVGEFVLEEAEGTWGGVCDTDSSTRLDMTLSGGINATIERTAQPWFGYCGIGGGISGGSTSLVFLSDGLNDDAEPDFVLTFEGDPGETGSFPLTMIVYDDISEIGTGQNWVTIGNECTIDVTRNEVVAPGLVAVAGTGHCDAPIGAYPPGPAALDVVGEFTFASTVILGDAGSEIIFQCCYGE